MISYADAFPLLSVSPIPKVVCIAPRSKLDIPSDIEAMTYHELKTWLDGLNEDELSQTMTLQMGRLIFAWGRPITYEMGGPGTYNPILVEKKQVNFWDFKSTEFEL